MKPETTERLRRLRADVRDRVLERACILHEACPGLTWDEADELALEQEVGDGHA